MKKGEKKMKEMQKGKKKSSKQTNKKKQEEICEHISTGKTKRRKNVFMFYVVMSD